MHNEKQITQANDFSNSVVELSDEDLQEVVGGFQFTAGLSGSRGSLFKSEPNGNQLLVRGYVGQVAIPISG
jgi:hypothetical protein